MNIEQSPFIPYGRQTITEEDISAVVETLKSPYLTQGPAVPAFEQEVAEKVSADHCVAVNSATSALHIACLALGLSKGDRLWTSPITFVASANCGRYCNAEVDFVDIDRSSGLMSMDSLTRKLEKAEARGELPKVLVPVHLTGSSCDMATINSLADRYGFSVVEDASHAIGGYYRGQPVGNCRYSNITVFSFHPVKIITTGEGGVATTNDTNLAQRMKELRCHGIVRDPARFKQTTEEPWRYEQQKLGFNYRMTDIQAALGLSQLKRLGKIVSERNRQLQYYREMICDTSLEVLKVPKDVVSSVHLSVVRLLSRNSEHHQQVFKGLRAAGIGVQLHYSPVHLQPYYQELGFKKGDFTEAEAYGNSAISLPTYIGLTKHEQNRVVQTLSELVS